MKRNLVVAASSLIAIGALSLAGCASSMVPERTRHSDSGITSAIEKSLEANEKVKARQVEVQTREGVVYLTGVVDTAEARREAGRVAWRTDGVDGVFNDLTVGETTVGSWVDDVMISSKVKSKLISNSEIKAGDIDVELFSGHGHSHRPRQLQDHQERRRAHRARHQGREGREQRTSRRQDQDLVPSGRENCDALDPTGRPSRTLAARRGHLLTRWAA